MVVSKSLIDTDGRSNRRAARTLKEILMAGHSHGDYGLPTLGAAAPEADTAASVHNPGSPQSRGRSATLLCALRGTGSGIFLDCSVRSLQDPPFPRPGSLLPGAKRQLGAAQQRRLHSKKEQRGYKKTTPGPPSERRFPLFRFQFSAKEGGRRRGAGRTRGAGCGRLRGRGSAACECVSSGSGGRSCCDFAVCFLPETPTTGVRR